MWWPHNTWNVTADVAACYQQFQIEMRPNWAKVQWGGFDLSSGSNIIFSNGLLDPWHTSGILSNLSPTLIAVVIDESAHHLDLRAPNPADPSAVTAARAKEAEIINTWLTQYWQELRRQLKKLN